MGAIWFALGAVAASAVIFVLAAVMRSSQISQVDEAEQIRRCRESAARVWGAVSQKSELVFCETCGRWKRPDELCRIATTAEDR